MTTIRKIQRYGYKPDLPDHRDLIFAPSKVPLPGKWDLSSKMPPIYDQGQLGSCFPAGTLVRMADGTERAIEDIRLGEYVVTAEGNLGMVNKTMLRLEPREILSLKLWGHATLRLTAEHPVLTRRGYVPASSLREDDFCALPRYTPPGQTTLYTAEFLSKTELHVKTGQRKMGTLPGRADVAVIVADIPETIALTPRVGRLIGLFLAEGSTSSGKAIWTFGAHEADTLVAETVDLLTDLGVTAHVQVRSNNSINVVVYGTAWSRFWSRLCGTGAGEKRIHPAGIGDIDFCEAMLRGWLAGDGYNGKGKGRAARTIGTSVSKQLAFAMYDIAQTLGLRPVIRREPGKRNSAAKVRRDYYVVDLKDQSPRSGPGSDNWRCQLEATHCWRKVRKVVHESFAGHVYNLGVEGDESYIAEGIGVHNCTGNGWARVMEYMGISQGEPAVTPSRLFIYYEERVIENSVGQDAGAEIRDGAKVVATKGVPPETDWPYDITKYANKPPAKAYSDALKHEALVYKRISSSSPGAPMRTAIAQGYPIVFGFPVPASFEDGSWNPATQILSVPKPNEQIIGGHCVTITGYDFTHTRFAASAFQCDNSWGADWGMGGRFWMDYKWFASSGLASDLWIVQKVS